MEQKKNILGDTDSFRVVMLMKYFADDHVCIC